MSARLRLTLSYAAFLMLAGVGTLVGIYVVLRYIPNYQMLTGSPRDIAGALGSQREILRAVVRASVAILGILLVIGLGGGWLLAGWILRPLDDINAAARIAATGRLDHRIDLADRTDEFGELAANFDHMLDRLHDAFMAQERFAANASHELRTPLAVTATMLEVALTDPDGKHDRELLDRLQITNARAIGLTEALLRLADANAVTARSEPVDLSTVVATTLKESAEEAVLREVRVDAQLDAAPVVGDAELLTQLVANLVQNAIRHNHPSGSLWVSTRSERDGDGAILRVENSGPTYTPALAAQLVEPFLRGVGRTSEGRKPDGGRAGGYGLGLPLVAQIAKVHDARLTIAPREGGGLAVAVGFSTTR